NPTPVEITPTTPTPTPTPTPSVTPTPTPAPGPGSLSFSSASYFAYEALTAVSITVNRTGGSTGTVGVDYLTDTGLSFVPCNQISGTAAQNCDFTYGTGTLTFGNGETSKTFNVLINPDAYRETSETIKLSLINPTGGATLGTPATATLTIADDPFV